MPKHGIYEHLLTFTEGGTEFTNISEDLEWNGIRENIRTSMEVGTEFITSPRRSARNPPKAGIDTHWLNVYD